MYAQPVASHIRGHFRWASLVSQQAEFVWNCPGVALTFSVSVLTVASEGVLRGFQSKLCIITRRRVGIEVLAHQSQSFMLLLWFSDLSPAK